MKNFMHKKNPSALGELQQNQLDQHSLRSSPQKASQAVYAANENPFEMNFEYTQPQQQAPRAPEYQAEPRGRSPSKGTFSNMSLRAMANGGRGKSREPSPTKIKKPRSGVGAFLPRPKSLKNLYKLATDQDIAAVAGSGRGRDKENCTPTEGEPDMVTPIYAQFATEGRPSTLEDVRLQAQREVKVGPVGKQRPASFHPQQLPSTGGVDYFHGRPSPTKSMAGSDARPKVMSWERSPSKTHRPAMHCQTSSTHLRSRSYDALSGAAGPFIDAKDIDTNLEAMLDRRNIPENQRYKMRNLNSTIKMEFIRQDWAEMQAKAERPGTNDSRTAGAPDKACAVADESDHEGKDAKPKRSRGKSFTLGRRGKSKDRSGDSSTKKGKGESTMAGRHARTRSTDSVGSDHRPTSASSSSGGGLGSGILSKIKFGHGPGDYVSYLRKVQKAELVEVGKLHKLRLLLRNETVSWTEDFIQQGGMQEIVGLLNRIMEVEWREEHEDALLHENLLCLKALCTTALAIQYLHSIQDSLFPKLLHMLFDPDKKGPSEFTTRTIITSVLFTYIESAGPQERIARAAVVLGHLRDPMPKEEDRPLPFVLEMHRERPYRMWNKEVVGVTKEVFWIFLHHLNVVALDKDRLAAIRTTSSGQGGFVDGDGDDGDDIFSYMARHFPQERPPVPAAPYVGGVEWDATNYVASHLDLLNAMVACTPGRARRNELRALLRVSGWERCMGGSLRLCKEKFYGAVHEGLRTWVAAAAEDGWDPKDVRYGPPPEATPRSPVRQSPKKKAEPPPRIDMPKLDFGGRSHGGDTAAAWLS